MTNRPAYQTEFRYRVNDVLTALAEEVGAVLPGGELNELTHHVADVLAEYRNRGEDLVDGPAAAGPMDEED